MRASDMADNPLTESEIAHIAGRRTADELTAHILAGMSKQIDALVAQGAKTEGALHSIQLAMADNKGDSRNMEQRVRSLESWRDNLMKTLVGVAVAVLLALFYAIANGAGLKLR